MQLVVLETDALIEHDGGPELGAAEGDLAPLMADMGYRGPRVQILVCRVANIFSLNSVVVGQPSCVKRGSVLDEDKG